MNRKQIICLWVGIAIIVLMGIFPPWITKGTMSGGSVQALPKYSFLLLPPYSDNKTGLSLHQIDINKLVIQWFMVALITGGLIVTFKNEKPKDEQKG